MRSMRYLLAAVLAAALTGSSPLAFGHDGMGGSEGANNPPGQVSAAQTYFSQGVEYSKQKSWSLAIQAYLEAVRLDPKYVEAWNNLGFCYRKAKRYDKAFDAYNQAVSLKPDYPNVHEYMGRTYLAVGNTDGALREYEILKRLDPKMAAELKRAIDASDPDLEDT